MRLDARRPRPLWRSHASSCEAGLAACPSVAACAPPRSPVCRRPPRRVPATRGRAAVRIMPSAHRRQRQALQLTERKEAHAAKISAAQAASMSTVALDATASDAVRKSAMHASTNGRGEDTKQMAVLYLFLFLTTSAFLTCGTLVYACHTFAPTRQCASACQTACQTSSCGAFARRCPGACMWQVSATRPTACSTARISTARAT